MQESRDRYALMPQAHGAQAWLIGVMLNNWERHNVLDL